jgi:magnesium transporter
MNEVMKVLTVVGTVFIPLTFIVGVYGMNFRFMPELDWPWAYPTLWAIMILLAGGMLLHFHRRGWL